MATSKMNYNNQFWRKGLLLVGLFLSLSSLFAQVKFYASTNKQVPVNANFQVNFTIENGNASNFTPPAFTDFQVLNGPSQSQSMQITNGHMSQSVTISYVLRPKKEGTYKLGKAIATVEGVKMESNELSIEVGKAAAQQQTQRRQNNPFDPFGDDPFGSGQEQEEPQAATGDVQKQIKENVFARIILSKSSVYLGEGLTATVKLYYKMNLGNLSIPKASSFEGFWSQEIDLAQKTQPKPTIEEVNGQKYYVAELQKYNLSPQRSGTLKMTPIEISGIAQLQVKAKRRSVWDDFFGGQVQNVPFKVESNAGSLVVKELPTAGKPADFSGAVGKFNFETSLSSKTAKTDEPVTYTVKISGSGNLKLIDAPKMDLPPNFEVYDPKIKENITSNAAGVSGSKQYDYLLIPRQPGDYKIPSRSFSYFNPETGKYVTTQTPEYSLNVTGEPSKNPNANNTASVNKEAISLLGQDIRYIKTKATDLGKNKNVFFGSLGFMGLYGTPFLLFAGLLFAKRRNEALASDVIGTKRRRATKLAHKRLAIAKTYLAKSDKKGFYDEVSKAMWGYLGDKLTIDQAELSKENVEEKLSAKNAKPETVSSLKSLINTCELALYSPIGEGGEMNKNYETAVGLITDLEDEIK